MKQLSKHLLRLIIEVAFIIFLFYTNLLMGEYIQGGQGYRYGFLWSVWHIATLVNFGIAVGAGLIGYIVFELLRQLYA